MEQHKRHMVVRAALQHRAQVERIGQQHVQVRVAEAGVKLHRQLLPLGHVQRRQHQVVVERLVGQADSAVARACSLTAANAARASSLLVSRIASPVR